MSEYQPPDKEVNRKRTKTGYNIFFTEHVQQLKQSENGVPSERGSVARIVGNAWKVIQLFVCCISTLILDVRVQNKLFRCRLGTTQGNEAII